MQRSKYQSNELSELSESSEYQQSDDSGYIYCLSNESYKDIYKIGFTKNNPDVRMMKLNTTGVPTPFKLEFAKQVMNYKDKEKKLHSIFDEYRVNKNREFFKMELKKIKGLFDLIDGQWYDNKNLPKVGLSQQVPVTVREIPPKAGLFQELFQPPPKAIISPKKEQVPITVRETPPKKEQVPITVRETPPKKEQVPITVRETPPKKEEDTNNKFKLKVHNHELELTTYKNDTHYCDYCEEGSANRKYYTCHTCIYDLCEECFIEIRTGKTDNETITFNPENMKRVINIHQEPKHNSKTIGHILYGDTIRVLTKGKLNWCYIHCNKIVGFIKILYCEAPKIPDDDTIYVSNNNNKKCIDPFDDIEKILSSELNNLHPLLMPNKNESNKTSDFLNELTVKRLQQLCISIPKKIDDKIVDSYISSCGTKDKLINKIIKSGYTSQEIICLISNYSKYKYIYFCDTCKTNNYTLLKNKISCDLCKNKDITIKDNLFFVID